MGVFVRLIIDYDICNGTDCSICIDTCPVNVFLEKNDIVDVEPEKEDECTFCGVCLERCPVNCIKIEKKY